MHVLVCHNFQDFKFLSCLYDMALFVGQKVELLEIHLYQHLGFVRYSFLQKLFIQSEMLLTFGRLDCIVLFTCLVGNAGAFQL